MRMPVILTASEQASVNAAILSFSAGARTLSPLEREVIFRVQSHAASGRQPWSGDPVLFSGAEQIGRTERRELIALGKALAVGYQSVLENPTGQTLGAAMGVPPDTPFRARGSGGYLWPTRQDTNRN